MRQHSVDWHLRNPFVVLQCFPCTTVPSVLLHVVECTFSGGFDSHTLPSVFGSNSPDG